MTKEKLIVKINQLLIDHFGVPKRNGTFPDPVDMLIATILSQNTNDNNSYKAYKSLKEKYPNWEAARKASRASIEGTIRVAGLGKQKSAAIKGFLEDLYNSKGEFSLGHLKQVDNSAAINELISYKGVGVKTASCVLLFAMNRNICPVDTHVHRTVNRLGVVEAKTPDQTFFKLNENFPPKIAHSFHTNLIRLGREICKPKNPSCGICPLFDICIFESKNELAKKSYKSSDFMLLDNVKKKY
jgi:endonuclease III